MTQVRPSARSELWNDLRPGPLSSVAVAALWLGAVGGLYRWYAGLTGGRMLALTYALVLLACTLGALRAITIYARDGVIAKRDWDTLNELPIDEQRNALDARRAHEISNTPQERIEEHYPNLMRQTDVLAWARATEDAIVALEASAEQARAVQARRSRQSTHWLRAV